MQLKNKNIFSEKIINALLAATFFSATLFLFAPLHTYCANPIEFDLFFSEMLPPVVAVFLFFTLCIGIGLALLTKQLHEKAIVAVTAFAFLAWFQGAILMWDYGLLTGEKIAWDRYTYRGIIDAGVWIICLALAVRYVKPIHKKFRDAGFALLIIQSLSLATILPYASELPSQGRYGSKTDTLTGLSLHKNVIIIVLDSFQADVFEELLLEDGSYKKQFSGFTFFRNTLTGFSSTAPLPTLFLTGAYYDNSIPLRRFMREKTKSLSLPKLLMLNGWHVELYSFPGAIYLDQNIATNITTWKLSPKIVRKKLALMYDVTLFRDAPHFLKQYIYHDQAWFLSRMAGTGRTRLSGKPDPRASQTKRDYDRSDSLFVLKRLAKNTRAAADEPVFKYIHVEGMHQPLLFNEDLVFEALEFNRPNYKRQARGILKLVAQFLDKLRQENIYDDSLLIILGDHGSQGIGVNFPGSLKGARSIHCPEVEDWIIERALPLLLVKPFNARGELAISDAPVCLSDIPTTVAVELKIRTNFPGIPLFEVKTDEIRKRYFYNFPWKRHYGARNFLPPMTEYVVTGLSWLPESWQATGRQLQPRDLAARSFFSKSKYGKVSFAGSKK